MAYDVAKKRAWAWRTVEAIARDGSAGKISAARAPGVRVGLAALRCFLDRTDPIGERVDGPPRITLVQINLSAPAAVAVNGHARAELPPGRLAIRLDDGHGPDAGGAARA